MAAEHFELMRKLHRVGLQSGIRCPRPSVSVRHDQFWENAGVAHLVTSAMVQTCTYSRTRATTSAGEIWLRPPRFAM